MFAAALAFAFSIFLSFSATADTCDPAVVQVRSGGTELRFSVELAETQESRAQGLMFRESMPRSSGMLFVFEKPGRVAFWMKNTLISLDMIFVDRTGRVIRVHHEAVPGDLTPIDGGRNVFAVLEINGGLAQRYGISEGAELRHPAFSDGPAVWSCKE
ncbi:DUF192 domain-containing protein [Primorskyibacter sp. S87]|uniref:DUF192 domain-containing protein n=1 Tax=Primorskyibacter sp. S87 TaxID=3415126 RepID=UPI003C79FECE